MKYLYDKKGYNPSAPVLPVTIRVPGNSKKHVTIDGLIDTGADITCLPKTIIELLDAEPAGTCKVRGITEVTEKLPPSYETYFLEFEITGAKELVEVVALGNKLLLGRNFINKFILQLHGPKEELSITLDIK
jgi:predicted aspartyl protease